MGDSIHVADGKVKGSTGSVVSAIIVIIFFSFLACNFEDASIGFKILYIFLSLLSIPIAVIGQRIHQKIRSALAGETVIVGNNLLQIITKKYAVSIMVSIVYEGVLLILLGKLFGFGAN